MPASEAARKSRLTACSSSLALPSVLLLPDLFLPLHSANSKRVIQNVPTFDFCADIVASVPDPISEGADGEPKKKRAPRKKKEVAPKDEDEEDAKPVKDEDDGDDYEE